MYSSFWFIVLNRIYFMMPIQALRKFAISFWLTIYHSLRPMVRRLSISRCCLLICSTIITNPHISIDPTCTSHCNYAIMMQMLNTDTARMFASCTLVTFYAKGKIKQSLVILIIRPWLWEGTVSSRNDCMTVTDSDT